ncbi:MAG: hypothetical protein RL494_460 [Bacteroidota bacterium]|jgi:hypothetical protein
MLFLNQYFYVDLHFNTKKQKTMGLGGFIKNIFWF